MNTADVILLYASLIALFYLVWVVRRHLIRLQREVVDTRLELRHYVNVESRYVVDVEYWKGQAQTAQAELLTAKKALHLERMKDRRNESTHNPFLDALSRENVERERIDKALSLVHDIFPVERVGLQFKPSPQFEACVEELRQALREGPKPEDTKPTADALINELPSPEESLLHYDAVTAYCVGGRNDTADWSRVTCQACLKSKPPTLNDMVAPSIPSMQLKVQNNG